ncbi:MAG: hypothetical protein ACRDFW_06160 [bacterium]
MSVADTDHRTPPRPDPSDPTITSSAEGLLTATVGAFCQRLSTFSGLEAADKALFILLWHEARSAGSAVTVRSLSRIFTTHGLGNPNRLSLSKKLNRSPLTLRTAMGFRLKAEALPKLRSRLSGLLGNHVADVNVETGYLPRAVWKDTRGYVEKVALQLNGCFQYGFYDAAAVMLRRIVETLIIEVYESLGRAAEITEKDGHYLMLGGLVERATGSSGLPLGREAKPALREIKKLGDRSAHNRRYNAIRADLDGIRSDVRLVVDELINIASLRSMR